MGWNNIALISDALSNDVLATERTMLKLHERNIVISVLEIFQESPSEAIDRIIKSRARVIVAQCYFDICPLILCHAYMKGLRGSRIIWVFGQLGSSDFVNSNIDLPDGCDREMLHAMDKGSFYQRPLSLDYLTAETEIGITGRMFEEFLTENIANYSTHPFRDSNGICIDNMLPVIFTLDAVERQLNQKGKTLKDEIESGDRHGLLEMTKAAIENINVKTFAGRIKYKPGERQVATTSAYIQSQEKGKRRMVFIDYGSIPENQTDGKFSLAPFYWTTPNKEAPLMAPTHEKQYQTLDFIGGKLITCVAFATAAIFSILATIEWMQIYFLKPLEKAALILVYIGVVLLLIEMGLFSLVTTVQFCQLLAPITSIALSAISGGLLARLKFPDPEPSSRFFDEFEEPYPNEYMTKVSSGPPQYYQYNSQRSSNQTSGSRGGGGGLRRTVHIETPPVIARERRGTFEINMSKLKAFKIACIIAISQFVFPLSIFLIRYIQGAFFSAKFQLVGTKYDEEMDVIRETYREICTIENPKNNNFQDILIYILLSFHLFSTGIVLIIAAKNRPTTTGFEFSKAVNCIYTFVPTFLFATFLTLVLSDLLLLFYILSIVLFVTVLIVSYHLFFSNANRVIATSPLPEYVSNFQGNRRRY